MIDFQNLSQETVQEQVILIYDYGLNSNICVYFWSDQSIIVKAIIRGGAIRLPKNLSNFINLNIDTSCEVLVQKGANTQKLSIVVKERRVKGKLLAYLIREIGEKHFITKSNQGELIQLVIPSGVFKFTKLLQTIAQYVQDGGNSKAIQKFLEEPSLANNLSLTTKITLIERLHSYLITPRNPMIHINHGTEQMILYNNDIIAAQFVLKDPTTKIICMPIFLDKLLVTANSRIYYLRKDILYSSSLSQNDYNKQFSSILPGEKIILLWGEGISRTKFFTKLLFYAGHFSITDSRFFLGLCSLSMRKDYPLLEKLFLSLLAQNKYLPIIRDHVMTSQHRDETFAVKVKELLMEASAVSPSYFVFEEALLSSKQGAYQKIVDWFLILNDKNNLRCYTIELKTLTNFHYKTRKLLQTIAEYHYLLNRIPAAGIAVIIINWKLNPRWRDYAALYGIVLLDLSDIETMISFQDFFTQVEHYVEYYLHSPSLRLQSYSQGATRIIETTIQRSEFSRKAIHQYSFYLGLTIQHIKNLLTYYEVMTGVDVNNRYHDNLPIYIDNPHQLLALHSRLLTASTAVIVEEELAFCRKQLTKAAARSENSGKSSPKISRRRETYDTSKLSALEQNLSLLLFLQPFWGTLQPLGARLYYHSTNKGQPFEEAVASYFREQGYQIIRNVVLRIGQRSQEVDLAGYLLTPTGELIHRCIISCTDKSSIARENLRKNIHMKYQLLYGLLKVLDSDYTGFLFVLVEDLDLPYIQELLEELQKFSCANIEIIIMGKKQNIARKANLNKCHREVSFESIYIVVQFFGDFILYSYRKIMLKIIWREKIKK